MKKVAVLQSNYIPWKGYFDIINYVDEFIIYDDMQYTRRDWRNRNKIKTKDGLKWLTIPVIVKGKFNQAIINTEVSDNKWAEKHWKTIHREYNKTEYYSEYKEVFEDIYCRASLINKLSEINFLFISEICNLLDITTKLSWDHDYNYGEGKSERLLSLCQLAQGTTYLSGSAAKGYLDVDLFNKAGVNVEWMDYSGYKEYPQPYGEFEHGVTILDLIFNTGKDARKYLRSFSI